MPKKASGLGRGLEDLLDDNSPQIKSGSGVIIKGESKTVSMSSPAKMQDLYDTTPKSLYNELPKNRSIKSNFKKP